MNIYSVLGAVIGCLIVFQLGRWVDSIVFAINLSRLQTVEGLDKIKKYLEALDKDLHNCREHLDECKKHLRELDNHFCFEMREKRRKIEIELVEQFGGKKESGF